jgi:hypothetical protein
MFFTDFVQPVLYVSARKIVLLKLLRDLLAAAKIMKKSFQVRTKQVAFL